jgi:hypothetical protein
MRQSYTATIEQNGAWSGAFATEPYEAAWATEAIFFVRALHVVGDATGASARVQISPDGMRWCDEGGRLPLPTMADEVTFVRVAHFGGFLRLVGEVAADAEVRVMAYLVLKS